MLACYASVKQYIMALLLSDMMLGILPVISILQNDVMYFNSEIQKAVIMAPLSIK